MDVEISTDKRLELEPDHLASSVRRRVLVERLRRQVERGFDHLRYEVRRVRVRVTDINGPRGGVDKRATLDVHLRAGDRVRAEDVSVEIGPAVAAAIARGALAG